MNQVVALGSILVGVCVALCLVAPDQFAAFIIAGHIPFTNLSIPPLLMLALWVFTLPLVVLLYRLTSATFWKSIETLGTLSQRHINRSIRWGMNHHTLPLLMASVLIHVAEHLPETTSSAPELIFRRRFIALPS